ncbi:MAG: response regulator transcription factor [Leptolinea sp.]|nr:response regulator transcription factor [Leptolinea sp.]
MSEQEKKKILIVDDEPQIVRVLQGYLEKAGFNVVSAMDGIRVFKIFQTEKPDFVILDLNLPGMDGLEICRRIRQDSGVPILMLTARSEEADKIVGLELGADDYIVKPFSPREIVARIKTIFRRVSGDSSLPQTVRAGDLFIDLDRHSVSLADRPIELTPTEFVILTTLARQPRRVFSRSQLMENALGSSFESFDRTIDTHIKNIRLKLEPDPKNPMYIQTVFGLGYKFEAGDNEN